MKKKRFSIKLFAAFIVYVFVFTAVTSPLILLYGPFKNLRKGFVSTIMATRHQYLITSVLSQSTIDKILDKPKTPAVVATQEVKVDEINVQHKQDTDIERFEVHNNRFDAYILEIKDPTRIKIAYTNKLGVEGEKTSDMAKEHNAVAAINGGAFVDKSTDGKVFAGTGALPGGFVISNGNVVYKDCSDNTKQNVIAFTREGKLIVGDHTLNDLKSLDVTEAICFRPPTLIINGKRQIFDKQADGYNPRTAVGQKADGTVIFVVVDGRKSLTKLGASLYDLQEIMMQHGAINAGNLDGGYSSTLYYNGEVINSPNAWDGERTVATSIYVEP